MISGDEALSEIGISVPQVRGHERTEKILRRRDGSPSACLTHTYFIE